MKLKESFKKFYQNRNLFIAVCVAILTLSSIGISYSAFFSVKSNTNNQTVTTGTLNVTYTGSLLEGEDLNTDNIMPLPDKEGLEQSNARIVNINNIGTLDSEYALTIGYDMASFQVEREINTDKLVPIELVKFAIYEYDTKTKASTLIAGPMSIADLPIYEYNKDDYRFNRYLILIGKVGHSGSDTSTKTYQIKTWLSDRTINNVSNSYFYINSAAVATVEGAKRDYKLSGKILDNAGNPVVNAKINIQNSSFTAVTTDTGEFTLTGVPDGTYNIEINNQDLLYIGNLSIRNGSIRNITTLPETFSALNDTDIFAYAYSQGTTINKIIEYNDLGSLQNLTDNIKLEAREYNIGPRFEIIAEATEITGVNITLEDNNKFRFDLDPTAVHSDPEMTDPGYGE